ncbi:MAG TPA: hypothetical protein VKA53_03885 [Thermoanaerobaculia bacterium]|nr:hypothetical protein [Thermoanaerobaculia bacterium]
MKTMATVVQMLIRLAFVTLVVLGVFFWTGHALSLILTHMVVGLVFASLMVTQGLLAAFNRQSPIWVFLDLFGALVVVWLGMRQEQLLAGGSHWIIQTLHLLVGLTAMTITELVAARIKRTA